MQSNLELIYLYFMKHASHVKNFKNIGFEKYVSNLRYSLKYT